MGYSGEIIGVDDDPAVRATVRATAERLSRDLAGDPKHIYKHKIQQESTPSRGS